LLIATIFIWNMMNKVEYILRVIHAFSPLFIRPHVVKRVYVINRR